MINSDKKFDAAANLVKAVLEIDVVGGETGKNGEAFGISFYYGGTGCYHKFYSLTDLIEFVADKA